MFPDKSIISYSRHSPKGIATSPTYRSPTHDLKGYAVRMAWNWLSLMNWKARQS